MAENMTFNTVAGQPVDRELLILFVNTGTDSAAVWSPLGTRVTDSSMEYDWQKDSNKDILGTTRTTMKKPIITQDFEPCELDAGDVALTHVWNLAVKEQNEYQEEELRKLQNRNKQTAKKETKVEPSLFDF